VRIDERYQQQAGQTADQGHANDFEGNQGMTRRAPMRVGKVASTTWTGRHQDSGTRVTITYAVSVRQLISCISTRGAEAAHLIHRSYRPALGWRAAGGARRGRSVRHREAQEEGRVPVAAALTGAAGVPASGPIHDLPDECDVCAQVRACTAHDCAFSAHLRTRVMCRCAGFCAVQGNVRVAFFLLQRAHPDERPA
jgi:hypothetical protein